MTVNRAFQIREARADDLPALAALHVVTFKEAHGERGAPNYELRASQWRTAFEHQLKWFCYVAEAGDGQLIGFAKGKLHDGSVPRFEGELNTI